MEVTGTNVAPLMYASEKYQVEELRGTCVKYMLHNMSQDTVATILDLGVFYNEERLVRKCINYLAFGSPRRLELLKKHHISKETLTMLVDCSDLAVKEIQLFKVCDNWAEVQCRKTYLEVNQDNKRLVLDDILTGIRFCSLTVEEMARIVTPTGLLTTQEELDIYRSIGSIDKSNALFHHERRTPTKLRASLPAEVMSGKYDGSFHVRVSCSKDFVLLGLQSTEVGKSLIKIGQVTSTATVLSPTPCSSYLGKPLMFRANEVIDIQHPRQGECPHTKWETFTVPCKALLPPHNTVFTMEVQHCKARCTRPSFSALIITY